MTGLENQSAANRDAPEVDPRASRRKPSGVLRALVPLGIAVVLSITVIVVVTRYRDTIDKLEGYGYLGAFAIGFLGNATVILPAPSLAVTAALGGVLNPFLVGIAAGGGEALGEMTGYLAGMSGKAFVENRTYYETIQRKVERHGGWVFLALATIPNPLFDLAGIAAGVVRFSIPRFLFSTWAGKTLKAIAFAEAGRRFLTFLLQDWIS